MSRVNGSRHPKDEPPFGFPSSHEPKPVAHDGSSSVQPEEPPPRAGHSRQVGIEEEGDDHVCGDVGEPGREEALAPEADPAEGEAGMSNRTPAWHTANNARTSNLPGTNRPLASRGPAIPNRQGPAARPVSRPRSSPSAAGNRLLPRSALFHLVRSLTVPD